MNHAFKYNPKTKNESSSLSTKQNNSKQSPNVNDSICGWSQISSKRNELWNTKSKRKDILKRCLENDQQHCNTRKHTVFSVTHWYLLIIRNIILLSAQMNNLYLNVLLFNLISICKNTQLQSTIKERRNATDYSH